MTSGPGRRPQALRLFFALWPSDGRRAALGAAAASVVARVEGRPVLPGNFHVTLAFLGRTPSSLLVSLMQLGGHGAWPTVDIAFERVEYWAKPKVLVAMPGATPVAGVTIVERLWAGLLPLGFSREARPWRPHLTLARRLRRPPPEDLALAPVTAAHAEPGWRLALVDSTTHPDGPRYNPLADWPLGDG